MQIIARKNFVILLPFLLLWAILLKHLYLHWDTNPQYAYGLFVPLLALYLLFNRWTDRPDPITTSYGKVTPALLFLLALFCLTWFLEQPNPEWRVVGWALTWEVIAITLCGFYMAGGTAWLRHFAFPVCFIGSAVPWGTTFEDQVVDVLTIIVARVTVELLNLCGIAAIQLGYLIEIHNGFLGIENACSGVRSLQAALMTGLFLGEFYRFKWRGRIVLVIAGALVAILLNIGRAFFLSWIASTRGMEAIAGWHDPAGYTISVVCFVSLWLLAQAFAPVTAPKQTTSAASPNPIPAKAAWSILLAVLMSLLVVEIWYRAHESKDASKWVVKRPPDAKERPISDPVKSQLQYDEGDAFFWNDPNNSSWTVFFFRWNAGAPRSTVLAKMHRPEICLPATGYLLIEQGEAMDIKLGETVIPFHAYVFSAGQKPAHVFYCIWKYKLPPSQRFTEEWKGHARIRAALNGERNAGQQVFEVVIIGYPTLEKAREALRDNLSKLIQFEK